MRALLASITALSFISCKTAATLSDTRDAALGPVVTTCTDSAGRVHEQSDPTYRDCVNRVSSGDPKFPLPPDKRQTIDTTSMGKGVKLRDERR